MTDRMTDLQAALARLQRDSGDIETDFNDVQDRYCAYLDAVDDFNVALHDVHRSVTTVKQLRQSRPSEQ